MQTDSLLSYQKEELLRDEKGVPVTRWDRRTMKRHPITGEEIPDEHAREEIRRPVNARMTPWPEAVSSSATRPSSPARICAPN
jgi:hypothetical protein